MRPFALLLLLAACEESKSRDRTQFSLEVEAMWRACDEGSAKQCMDLDAQLAAKMLVRQELPTSDERLEVADLRRTYNTDRLQRIACTHGDAVACYEKGKRAVSRGTPYEFTRGCELGHQPSCEEVERRRR